MSSRPVPTAFLRDLMQERAIGQGQLANDQADVKHNRNISDPRLVRASLAGLMRGMGGPNAPLGVLPDGSVVRDVTPWVKAPSRIVPPFGGLDDNDLYQLAKTMVPRGASSRGQADSNAPDNIQRYLPGILSALQAKHLDDQEMWKYALAPINPAASRLAPVSEGVRRGTGKEANTTTNGQPFDKYDYRTDLGNNGEGQGALYRGRGFIQLTGKDNYEAYGKAIGHPELVDN